MPRARALKPRIFVLNRTTLNYYAPLKGQLGASIRGFDAGEHAPRGSIDLSDEFFAVIDIPAGKGDPNCFILQTGGGKDRKGRKDFFISASSKEDKDDWIRDLQFNRKIWITSKRVAEERGVNETT